MSGPLAVWQPNLPDGSYKILVHAVMWKLLYSRILSQLFEGGRVPSNMYSRTEPLEISLQVDSEFLVWRGGGVTWKNLKQLKLYRKLLLFFLIFISICWKNWKKISWPRGPPLKSKVAALACVIWYDKNVKNYINMESKQTTMIIWIDPLIVWPL